jgi:hypothetical protein
MFRKTTDSRHNYALVANLLIDRNHRGPLWASDITFVPTGAGWLYVSAVMSVQSRKDHWAVYKRPVVGGASSYSTQAGYNEGEATRGINPPF